MKASHRNSLVYKNWKFIKQIKKPRKVFQSGTAKCSPKMKNYLLLKGQHVGQLQSTPYSLSLSLTTKLFQKLSLHNKTGKARFVTVHPTWASISSGIHYLKNTCDSPITRAWISCAYTCLVPALELKVFMLEPVR